MESTIEKCHCGKSYDGETFTQCPFCYVREGIYTDQVKSSLYDGWQSNVQLGKLFNFGKSVLTQKALKELIADLQKTYDERA